MGRHVFCLSPESVVSMLEFSAISEALNVIGIGIVKISVCLTLLRVVERGRHRISQFLWCLLVFVAVTHLALAMLFFLHCRPLAALWNPAVRGSCLSTQTTVLAGYIGFAIDVVTDLLCAGIPVLVIHRLQLNFRTKVALCVLMGLGVFTAACAVAKAITLKGVFADDYTWGFTKPATWAAGEQFVGIIISSIPALRPLFSRFLEKSRSRSRSGIGKYFFWGWKTYGPEINDSSQPTPSKETPSNKGAKAGKTTLFRWSKETSEGTSSDDTSSPTTVIGAEDNPNAFFLGPELEKGSETHPHAQKPNMNFLHAWSLPNVADRRSAIFSIPYLDPVRLPGPPCQCNGESPGG